MLPALQAPERVLRADQELAGILGAPAVRFECGGERPPHRAGVAVVALEKRRRESNFTGQHAREVAECRAVLEDRALDRVEPAERDRRAGEHRGHRAADRRDRDR
jgi:hypothetical protein